MSAFDETTLLTHEQKIAFVSKLDAALSGHGCDHDYPHAHARRILDQLGLDMPGVENVLEFFRQHGGFCDCEIIMNVLLADEDYNDEDL